MNMEILYLTGVSCVSEEGRLNAIAGRQPLLQLWGELLTELLPVLLSNLVLKAMQDLQQIALMLTFSDSFAFLSREFFFKKRAFFFLWLPCKTCLSGLLLGSPKMPQHRRRK